MEEVRDHVSIVSFNPQVLVHHCIGEQGKHNKIHIGHDWLLPLTQTEHLALHSHGATFGYTTIKEFEKRAFKRLYEELKGSDNLPPPEVYESIMDWHR